MKKSAILLGFLASGTLVAGPGCAASTNTAVVDLVALGAVPATTPLAPLQVVNTKLSPPAPSSPSGIPVGPQSLLLNFVNGYTTGFVVDVSVTLTGASFASVDSFGFYAKNAQGALVPAAVSGCSKTVSRNVLTFRQCVIRSGTFDALSVIGATYFNAAALAKVGNTITAIAKVADAATIYELSQPTTLVVSVAPADTGTDGTNTGGSTDGTGGTGSTTGGSSGGTTPVTATGSVHLGPVFSTISGLPQSFLRFHNGSQAAGTVTVALSDPATGNALNRWTSPSIAPGASVQFPVSAMESPDKSLPKPSRYAVAFTPGFQGDVQHVAWNTDKGTLVDQTECDSGKAATGQIVINAHSTGVSGYPSSILVVNPGATSASADLQISDADTGRFLSTYPTVAIPPGGSLLLPVSQIEVGANLDTASPKPTYYNIAISSQFTGFLGHFIDNLQPGVETDMTTVCGFDKTSG